MTTAERVWALINSVRYVIDNDIEGDFVECGVWRGGSAMAMTFTLADLGATRQVWLYDTFAGMTQPTSLDVEATSGDPAARILSQTEKTEGRNAWCIASLADVQANMDPPAYSQDRIRFRAGDVAETLTEDLPSTIALLRLDTDWYESTKVELEILYPRLASGGVCIIDDYGALAGARKAVDEILGGE